MTAYALIRIKKRKAWRAGSELGVSWALGGSTGYTRARYGMSKTWQQCKGTLKDCNKEICRCVQHISRTSECISSHPYHRSIVNALDTHTHTVVCKVEELGKCMLGLPVHFIPHRIDGEEPEIRSCFLRVVEVIDWCTMMNR